MDSPTAALEDVVARAVVHAGLHGHHYVGPEHLLLALLAPPRGPAVRALRGQSVDVDGLRGRLEAIIGQADRATTFQHGLTHRARLAIIDAHRAARRRGRATSEVDLLAAILRQDEGVAARVLRRYGARSGPLVQNVGR